MSDANMLFVPKGDILNLLKRAFDEGWNGYQDLRDVTAERLLDEYLDGRRKKLGKSVPTEVRLEPMPEMAFTSGTEWCAPGSINRGINEGDIEPEGIEPESPVFNGSHDRERGRPIEDQTRRLSVDDSVSDTTALVAASRARDGYPSTASELQPSERWIEVNSLMSEPPPTPPSTSSGWVEMGRQMAFEFVSRSGGPVGDFVEVGGVLSGQGG